MERRSLRQILISLLLASGLLSSSGAFCLELGYGGRLSTANGAPVEGPVNLTFRFFSLVSGGTQLGEIPVPNVSLVDGMFQVVLNLSSSQVQDIFQGGSAPVFIETVQGDQVYPRQRFSFVPFALRVPIDENKLRYVDGKLTLHPGLLEASGGVTSVNLSQPAAGLTVSGGPITSTGSISIGLANDLAAVESLSTTGVVERTGPDTWSTFPITQVGKDFLTATDAPSQRSKLGLGNLATQSSLTSTDVTEGTNLYFTTTRARDALSATAPLFYATGSGVFSIGQASGTASGYLSAADFLAFTSKQGPITPTSTLQTASLTTASQAGLELKPDLALTNQTGELRFDELAANGENYVGFKAPSSISSNRVWTLPSADGTTGQVLTTNGAGILSWGTVSGGGGGGSVTSVNLTPPAAGITVDGGPIINSGSIDINLSNDLAAVEGLTGTGGVERIGSDSWTTYPLTSAGKALLDDANPAAQRTTLELGLLATLDTVNGAHITNGSVTNEDLSATAEIAQSKIANLSADLAAKEAAITSGTTAQYYRGDKSWQTLDTGAVPEGSRLYFTSARARQALSATAPLSYSSSTGVISIPQASSWSPGYLSASDFLVFNSMQPAISTATVLNAGTITSSLQNGLEIRPYGSVSGRTGELRFDELQANGANYIGFKAADTLATNTIWTLPLADGTNGQVLSTNGSGVLSWTSASAALGNASGDLSGTYPGPTVTQVGGVTATNVASGANAANDATSTNTASRIVMRDPSGNFSAGTITANLTGNATNVTGTVAVANGGTGATSFTSNGILVGAGASNLSATAAGTQYQVLRAGAGGAPAFGAINLDQAAAVTGTLPVANGGTGVTSATANQIFAGPSSGVNAAPGFRALVANDIPSLDAGKISTGTFDNARINWASPGAIGATTQSTGAFSTLSSTGATNLATTSGNVGIGITSPQFTLSTGNGGTIAASTLRLQNSYLENGGYGIQLAGIDNGINGHDLRIQGRTGDGAFADLMTVKSSGNVGIGTQNPGAKLQIYNSFFGGGAGRVILHVIGGDVGDQNYYPIVLSHGGSNVFYVNASGNGWMAGTLSQASDERLKTNITTSPHGLADVLKMRGVNYQWKSPERGEHIELGLIAQEVESIIPEVVRTNSDGFKSIAYSNLIPLLVEAIKDLKREKDQEMERMVKAHRTEIQQLKAENQEIRAKLDQLMQHMTLTPD